MMSFKSILVFFLVVGILLFVNQKEKYSGQRKYISHGNSNYPGGDIDGNGQWVKNTGACRKLCDAQSDTCKGFVVSKKRNTTQPKDKQLKCYLKTADAFSTQNRVRDTNWNSSIESQHYTYWKGNLASSGGWALGVRVYNDDKWSQGMKLYVLSPGAPFTDYTVTGDFPFDTDGGVTTLDVPKGLTVELWGKPDQLTTSYTRTTTSELEKSGPLTGKISLIQSGASSDGVTYFGQGAWNDRVMSIRVSRA